MPDIVKVENVGLPQLPIVMPALEGKNLDKGALMLQGGYGSAEEAIVRFRTDFAPESLKWFRRYYLQPQLKGGISTGRYSLRYVSNTKQPKTDKTIGTVESDDVAGARILIGNNMAGAFMTPIRWELCEDRDGEEPIVIGRFDPWSLLQGISAEQIERLGREKGLVPNSKKWDFDLMYFGRQCPSCKARVTINRIAFDIDSAKCVHCGIRPFLSGCFSEFLKYSLPSATGEEALIDADYALQHAISWLGQVNAKADELHQGDLPETLTPHQALKELLTRANLVALTDAGATALAPSITEHFMAQANSRSMIEMAQGVANALAGVIESGGPFTHLHEAMAKLLFEMKKESEKGACSAAG